MDWLVARAKSKHKRLLNLRTPCTRTRLRNITPSSNQRFDEATGQVYTETTAPIQTSNDLEWTRQTVVAIRPEWIDLKHVQSLESLKEEQFEEDLGSYRRDLDNVRNSRIRGFKGARQLQDVAVECILQNINDVTFEGLEFLPIQLVRRIWHAVNKRCLLSFDTWLIFSKLLHKEEEATVKLMRYAQQIKRPKSPLHVYTAPLTSPSFEFMTSLSITIPQPLTELVKISSIKNLGSLEIIHTRRKSRIDLNEPESLSPVTDRLIRTWHHAAQNDGAFPVLRIMRLWSHPELTHRSLIFLNSFPALAVYDVRWCVFELDTTTHAKTYAKELGWKATLEPNVLGLLEAACVERVQIMQGDLGTDAKPIRKSAARQLWDGSSVRRIPRSDITAFLIDPESFNTDEIVSEMEMHTRNPIDPGVMRNSYGPKGHRRNITSTNSMVNILKTETWDFSTTTTFSKIGELRDDTDLKRAGVKIGHQAVVDNELVNSIPMVSLRLGPSDWTPDSSYREHKKIYTMSMYSDAPPRSPFGNEEDRREFDRYEDAPGREKAEALAFIRIRVPKPMVMGNMRAVSMDVQGPRHAGERFDIPVGVNTRASASVQTLPTERGRRKKRKLGDVLSTFF